MSVEKMDAYKERKANRKKEIARERRNKKIAKYAWRGAGVVVVVALCAAIGLTGWSSYKSYQDSLPDYSVTTQVVDDIAGVTEDDEAWDDEEETDDPEEEAEEEADGSEDEAGEDADGSEDEAGEDAEPDEDAEEEE